jgi:catechol 2,3-dioxygenase-like lactoylglutathione lyase family enzyme
MNVQVQGIHHIALVCKDINQTIDFYTTILGLKLLEMHPLPEGGKHFSFGIGQGVEVAFFWFPNAPQAVPGIASVKLDAWQTGDILTAEGSMHHLAFTVPLDELDLYQEQLETHGIFVTPVVHHDVDRLGQSSQSDTLTSVSSIYFYDPSGILLEFAANVYEPKNQAIQKVDHES